MKFNPQCNRGDRLGDSLPSFVRAVPADEGLAEGLAEDGLEGGREFASSNGETLPYLAAAACAAMARSLAFRFTTMRTAESTPLAEMEASVLLCCLYGG